MKSTRIQWTFRLLLGAGAVAVLIWGGLVLLQRQERPANDGTDVVGVAEQFEIPTDIGRPRKDVPYKEFFDSLSKSADSPLGQMKFTDKYGFRIFYTPNDSECDSPGLPEEKAVAMAAKIGLREPSASWYASYWMLSVRKLNEPNPLNTPPLACAWTITNYESGSDFGPSWFGDVTILDLPQKEYESRGKVACSRAERPGLTGVGTTYCAPQGMLDLFLSAKPPGEIQN